MNQNQNAFSNEVNYAFAPYMRFRYMGPIQLKQALEEPIMVTWKYQ